MTLDLLRIRFNSVEENSGLDRTWRKRKGIGVLLLLGGRDTRTKETRKEGT